MKLNVRLQDFCTIMVLGSKGASVNLASPAIENDALTRLDSTLPCSSQLQSTFNVLKDRNRITGCGLDCFCCFGDLAPLLLTFFLFFLGFVVGSTA